MKHLLSCLSCLLLFNLSCNTISSQKQNPSDGLFIEILEETVEVNKKDLFFFENKSFQSLSYRIINNTNNNYAVVLDTQGYFIYETTHFKDYTNPNDNIFNKQYFQPCIIVSKENGDYTKVGYIEDDNYFSNLPSLDETINQNLLILKKQSSYIVTSRVTLPVITSSIKNKEVKLIYEESVATDKRTHLFLKLFQDSNLVSKYLNKENLYKIKKENATLYSGTISSNKIPYIVK